MIGNFWACFGVGLTILIKCSPLGSVRPHLISISFLTQLSGYEWILQNNCAISFVCHILDDFLITEPPAPTAPFNSLCQVSISSMMLSFKNLNIPISAAKTEGHCKVIQFMGNILDSYAMEARLPEDKIQRIKTTFSEFRSKRSTTLQELQSLIGTLNFACKVICPGRTFLQRMISLTRGVKNPITTSS